MLRPGIAYGPRSSWITGLAWDLLSGSAYLVDGSPGIFNGIYVDNLLDAIQLAATTRCADGHVFLVGDAELVTWVDFYHAVAQGLGVDMAEVARIPPPRLDTIRQERVLGFFNSESVRATLPWFPRRLKDAVKAGLSAMTATPASDWALASPAPVRVTREMALLQQCRYKLPYEKARRMLGYEATVSFQEGMRRSIGWLQFAGYPVVHAPGANVMECSRPGD